MVVLGFPNFLLGGKLEFSGDIMAAVNPSVSRCSFMSKADKMAADSSPEQGEPRNLRRSY